MTADAHGIFSGKRLVIFGAGYIGSEVARTGMARGMRVTALTRNVEKATELRRRGVETVVANLAGHDWHERIEGGAEFVLNCVSSGGGGIAAYAQSYLEGMRSILQWAKQRGPVGTLVYTSSTSVYPQGDGATVDETAATHGDGERPKVLVATEEILRASSAGSRPSPSAESGQGSPACDRWFILRLAGIYGPTRRYLLEQVAAGEIAGRGEHRLNLAHRDDIVAAIWAVMGAPSEIRNEVFNVADDGAAAKAEITDWLAAQMGLPRPRFTGEAASGRRGITPDRIIANGKLKHLLGWRPEYSTYRKGYGNLGSR